MTGGQNLAQTSYSCYSQTLGASTGAHYPTFMRTVPSLASQVCMSIHTSEQVQDMPRQLPRHIPRFILLTS